ncbi:hypothetical protein E3N88_19822 [Mikania micrantha]|uniref:Uncharacterized protein n=1 Tax=Mikania micrantha TaxID=192012 RepID=A0A5N6NPE8_9ASTR|nr:hypothetical protein E3N88_19822 [Mikania micrantha]
MRRSNARVASAVDNEKMKLDNSMKLKFRSNQSLRSTNLFSRNQKQQSYLTKSNVFVIGGENGLGSMRVSPGLSAFAEDPNGAGASLLELLEFAKKRIPKENWGKTEVRLMATAGLRMLDLSVQERVLESCRKVLRTSGFAFQNDWASVISGSDEGVHAWVVANYALGTLGGDTHETTGIIELGGASVQVTFFSSEPIPPEFSRIVKFGNASYRLYSHSLLELGQVKSFTFFFLYSISTESFDSKVLLDPCSPKGYKHDLITGSITPNSLIKKSEQLSILHASGNFSECRSASLTLLQKGKEECAYEQCYIGSTFIPKLQGKFLATENFFHTSKFFGLSSKTFLSELMVAGKQFCEEDWSKLRSKYPSFNAEDLHHYCFSSAYIVALLHDSLGIALDDKRIGYANQVNNIPLDWALGAFILQITSELDAGRSHPLKFIITMDSSLMKWNHEFVLDQRYEGAYLLM